MEFILIILSSILFTIPYYFPALFFLSWLAFIPLIYLIKDYDYSHSFIIALLVGLLNSIFSLYWLYQPLSSVLKMPFSFNLFILFIYFLISALPLALWVLLNKFLQPEYSYSPFIAALSWTVIEYLRFEFFNFNPFNYFAYTQSAFSVVVQYAAYGGIFLVSFISVLIASYILKIYLDPAWKKAVPLVFILLLLVVIPFFIQSTPELEVNRKSVDLLVAKSGEAENVFEKIEKEISNLSSLAADSKSEFIFTPAKSLSFDLIRNNYYRDQLFSQLESSLEASYLQLGAEAAAETSYNAEILNSLFLISEEMDFINRSNQQRNILAGINFPYLEELRSFAETYLNISSDLIENNSPAAAVELEELKCLNLFAGEIFIPLVSRKENYASGQNLIVYSAAEASIDSNLYNNLSFAAGVYRAAETNTDLIRAVSDGYSGQINERGKIIFKKRIENNHQTVDLILQNKESYYQRYPERIINIIISIFLMITLIKVIMLLKNKWSSRD
ncbi:MAG: copper homeostasis protein CutE [Halanaerobium sp.]